MLIRSSASVPGATVVVEDKFGRNINQHGLTLVDQDGYMANPAIEFFIVPPPDAHYPAWATVTANNERLYFDFPGTFGETGPSTHVYFADAHTKVPLYIGNAPDRDSEDGHYQLTIRFTDSARQTSILMIPIHEIDQDRPGAAPRPGITVDFSQDRTGFFNSARAREIVLRAVADWAYFFDDMKLDPVPAGAESTDIWDPDGFNSQHTVTNAKEYDGYLLYVYGVHGSMLRSGGSVSSEGPVQTSGGRPLPLRRSGGVAVETAGNYNELGWFLDSSDADWWVSGNMADEQNDLFAIVHHETGHAIAFDVGQPKWREFKEHGCLNDPAVIAYHGVCPKISSDDHFPGAIDNESLKGGFGNEYYGIVPNRRWIITKFDLLAAQAVGYKLRRTSAFIPTAILSNSVDAGTVGRDYSMALRAEGGIPFYNWTIAAGQLPPGLALDSFSGVISGTPRAAGTWSFTVRLQDYAEGATGVTRSLAITVNAPATGRAKTS